MYNILSIGRFNVFVMPCSDTCLRDECSLPQSLFVQKIPNDLKGGLTRNAGPM
jgi:hypothetical protein